MSTKFLMVHNPTNCEQRHYTVLNVIPMRIMPPYTTCITDETGIVVTYAGYHGLEYAINIQTSAIFRHITNYAAFLYGVPEYARGLNPDEY